MTSVPDGPPVVDVTAESRFVVTAEGREAELVYELAPGRLVLVHTGVPDELGGRGMGGRLVRAAVERASSEHLVVVPWCPFARRWLRQHPEVADGVQIDWDDVPSTTR